MLLLQDVSINDVNEVIKKVGNIFRHTSASNHGLFSALFFSQNDIFAFAPKHTSRSMPENIPNFFYYFIYIIDTHIL
jgi:hypothetical protein